MSAWWNYAANKREAEAAREASYAERRRRNSERAQRVTADVEALSAEISGYTDMEFVTFARAITAEVIRLRERVKTLEGDK